MTVFATIAGWRNAAESTSVPSRTRSVSGASAASVESGSSDPYRSSPPP